MRTPYEYYFANKAGVRTAKFVIWLDNFEENHIGQVGRKLLDLDGVGYSDIVMKKVIISR